MESEQKLIVITGASSGIGKCCAEMFGKYQNYKLLLLSRRVQPMQELNLPNALCLSCDILNFEQYKECIEKGEKQFNLKVDCLINSAGFGKIGPSLSYDFLWDKIIDMHLKGLLNSVKLVLEQMKERKSGTIIEIGSVAGLKTRPLMSIYGASKNAAHAVQSLIFNNFIKMIENMREELSPYNIRLSFIAPGMTETPIFDTIGSDEIKKKLSESKEAMGGFLPAEKIAEAALFMYQQPQTTCIREIVFAPTKQA